ncbi:MAG: ABC transporter permease [bacterium]|nr:ABC transporter permease [bacterium]
MQADTPTPIEPHALGQSRLGGLWAWSLSLSMFAAVLALWHGAVVWYRLPPLVLPLPSEVAMKLLEVLMDGSLLPHLWVTLSEILLGFLTGSVLGIGLGSLLALSPFCQRVLSPYIIASQAMPKLALAPLFVLWFGFGIFPKALIAALIAFFPLFENTMVGLQVVETDALELFRMLGASRWQVFLKLRLPNATPYLFAGLRVSIVLSVVGAVVGEYVGASRGLGALIIASQGMMDTALMFAVFIVLTLLGIILYQLVRGCDRWVLARRQRIQPSCRAPFPH